MPVTRLIVEFAREAAIATLPQLLKTREDRELAAKVVQFIPGAIDEMAPHTLEMLQTCYEVLGLPPATVDITEDPLAGTGQKPAPRKSSGAARRKSEAAE